MIIFAYPAASSPQTFLFNPHMVISGPLDHVYYWEQFKAYHMFRMTNTSSHKTEGLIPEMISSPPVLQNVLVFSSWTNLLFCLFVALSLAPFMNFEEEAFK